MDFALSGMKPVLLLPAEQVPLAARADLLNAAYADYRVPFHITPGQVKTMTTHYDVDLARSLVARVDGAWAGMALLSCRGERGWVSAVGVMPAWRRQGVARRLLAGLIANARAAGLRVLTLEVIDANTPARQLYRSFGFSETRELLCWRFPADADPLPIPAEPLVEADPASLLADFDAWHDQPPCWQREQATLRHMCDRARGYRLALDNRPAAYCLVNDYGDTVSILDVGINPRFGPVRAGRAALQALAHRYRGRLLTITNVPADDGLNRALAALHFLVTIRQWEMRLPLSP